MSETTSPTPDPRVLLVDGNNCLARADFAARGKHVEMSAQGVNTSALVIFVNMLSKYVRMTSPTHLAVMWDAGHKARDEAYPAYKAARKKPLDPSEDSVPFALAKEFLTWAGVPHKAHQGWEADDLIAATAQQCYDDVAILSGDKDLLQLVREPDNLTGVGEIVQYRLPDDVPWDVDRVEEKFGVRPEHLASYLALVGDPGDGVPGVKGLGPKKALRLLQEAGMDWEALLALLGPERAAEASLMRSLVDLRDYDYPQPLRVANCGVPPFLPTAPGSMEWTLLEDFLDQYQMKSIHERLVSGDLWVVRPRTDVMDESLFDGVL